MKNTRAIWMLAVSCLLGVLVVFMVGSQVSQPAIASTKVVVASADLELGSKLNPQVLSIIEWPRGSAPAGTFADLKDVQGRIVKTSLTRGEAILSNKLAPVGSAGGLSAVIANGKRAMTVRVNDVVGVAGFALPGNYVDILVNARQDKEKGGDAKSITKTVLEHVLVLAVAQEAGRDDTKPKLVNAVTLELSPAEAEKIDLARNIGTLSLVLRNQIDKTPVTTVGAREGQLFGEQVVIQAAPVKAPVQVVRQAASRPVVALAKQDCVEVIHGGERRLSCF